MNKSQRMELAEFFSKFGKTLPNKKDEFGCDVSIWDDFGDQFYDWLETQKHSFDMNKLFDLMMLYRVKLLVIEDNNEYYEGWWVSYRDAWESVYKKFVLFCVNK